MSAEPTTTQVVTSTNPVVTSWLKQHETIILVGLGICLCVFVAQKYFDLSSLIETHKFQEVQAALQTQQQKTDTDLAQAKQMLATYQQTLQQTQVQNTQLVNVIAQRDKQLITQQQKDTQLTPSQLSTRWQTLIGDTGVQDTTNGFAVTQSAGLNTVQQIEQIPVLKQNLVDEQTKENNLQNDVTKANDLIGQGKLVVNGLNLQLTDEQKSCTTQIAAVKAADRKSKLKIFFEGVVVGFIAGVTKPW